MTERRGAIVWRAEPGGGLSSLLDDVLADLATLPDGGPLVLRTGPAAAAPPRALVRSLLEQAAGGPGTADVTGPDVADPDVSGPDAAAARFASDVAPLLAGRTLVLAVDDLDLLDAACRASLDQVVARRAPGVVVLGTATRDDAHPALSRAFEVRDLQSFGAGDALALLASQGHVVAPHVAAHLARELAGDAAALVETAGELA